MPNANKIWQNGDSPKLKNDFSGKVFYDKMKIYIKSSYNHKIYFLRNQPRAYTVANNFRQI